MTKAYLMYKEDQTKHAYSMNVRTKLEEAGWKLMCVVSGINMSFTHMDRSKNTKVFSKDCIECQDYTNHVEIEGKLVCCKCNVVRCQG